MAGTVRELFEGAREGSVDPNSATLRRQFLVTGTTPDTVLSEPGLPTPGSFMVYNQRVVRVDNRTVESTSIPNAVRVTVNYSSDGRGKLPPRLDKTEPKFKTISLSYVRDELKLPAFRKRLVKQTKWVSPPGGGPPAPEEVVEEAWEPYDFSVPHYYTQLQSRCNVEKFTASNWAEIVGQQGKIHAFGIVPPGSFGGARPGGAINTTKNLWKFIGAQVDQQGENLYAIVYTWISDPGNGSFNFIISASQSRVLVPYGIRYAFETYFVTPQAVDPGDPGNVDFPEIDAAPAFDLGNGVGGEIGEGYKRLPGSPAVL